MTKQEIEEKYWYNFTFDKPIEFIPRLYNNSDRSKIDKNKILYITPFKMKDYTKFTYSVKSLQYNKNIIPDVNIIRMTYFDYIMYLIEQENENKFPKEDERADVMYKFFYIISKSLGIDIETVVPSIDENNRNILLLNFKQRFVKCDKYIKNALFVVKKASTKNQIDLDYVNAVNAKYGYDTFQEFDYVINSPVEDDIIVLTSKDIDYLKQIICYQNIIHYDDEPMDAQLKKDIERANRLKSHGKGMELRKQIINIMNEFPQIKTIEDIEDITIRMFFDMCELLQDKESYRVQSIGRMSGLVTIENPLGHYLCDNYDKYATLVNQEKIKADTGNK